MYEFNLEGNHVMRRRQDNWINATHILKVANLDKPARTRILEREVQKGIHEKVQGGYGKYQGPSSSPELQLSISQSCTSRHLGPSARRPSACRAKRRSREAAALFRFRAWPHQPTAGTQTSDRRFKQRPQGAKAEESGDEQS